MTEQIIIFRFKGNPIAKKRPRFARRGKFISTYSEQETEEGRFLWELRRQWAEDRQMIEGPISLTMYFDLAIPKSASKLKAEAMAEGNIKHTKKPDIDNLIKFSLDVMNGEVWRDDSQIVSIKAMKGYSLIPETWIEVAVI